GPRGRGAGGPGAPRRRTRAAHVRTSRARRGRRRRVPDRHAGPARGGSVGLRRGRGGRIRRCRGARRAVSVRRLRTRDRARVCGPRRARRRHAPRTQVRELAQATTRDRLDGATQRRSPASGGAACLEASYEGESFPPPPVTLLRELVAQRPLRRAETVVEGPNLADQDSRIPAHPRTCSISYASSSSVRSSPCWAEKCTPIGRPCLVRAIGSETAGPPAALFSGVNAT